MKVTSMERIKSPQLCPMGENVVSILDLFLGVSKRCIFWPSYVMHACGGGYVLFVSLFS